MKRASSPVRTFWPNESRKIMAHATTGTFLHTEATRRTTADAAGWGRVVREANIARTRAAPPASTVAMIDTSTVSASLRPMFGRAFRARAFGIKFTAIHEKAFGTEARPAGKLKSVASEEPTVSAPTKTTPARNSRLRRKSTLLTAGG